MSHPAASTQPVTAVGAGKAPRNVAMERGRQLLNRTRKLLQPKNKDAAAFLASRTGAEHPALDFGPSSAVQIDKDEPAIYVQTATLDEIAEEEAEEVPPEVPEDTASQYYKECFDAHRRYEDILHKCLELSKDPATDGQGDRREAQTFEQVETDIESACTHLESVSKYRQDRTKPKTFAGVLHTAFAGFRNHARDVRSFVSLLPKSCEFGSVICGGLCILLKAAEKYGLWEKTFTKALTQIKEAMVDRAYSKDRYPPDGQMHTLISRLFASIFAVLELLVQWVFKHHVKRFFAAILQPETYGRELMDRLATMETRCSHLKMYGREREIAILGANLEEASKKNLEAIDGATTKTLGAIGAVSNKIDKLIPKGTTETGETPEKTLARMLAGRNVYIFLASDPPWLHPPQVAAGKRRPASALQQVSPASSGTRTQRTFIDADTLLSKLRPQVDSVAKDCRNVINGCRLDREGDQTVTELCKHVRVQAFLEKDTSYVMLIEGGPRSRNEGRGSMTLFSAKVMDALLKGIRNPKASVYALGYFCSEHRQMKQMFGTARDMIITLTLQLIDQHRDFDPSLLGEFRDTLGGRDKDVGTLCDLFQRFVESVPEDTTVFCMMEGIGLWEAPKSRVEQTSLILERLLRLGRDEDRQDGGAGPKVKCLFTTPARSTRFKELFEPYEVFTLYNSFTPSGLVRQGTWGRRRRGLGN